MARTKTGEEPSAVDQVDIASKSEPVLEEIEEAA